MNLSFITLALTLATSSLTVNLSKAGGAEQQQLVPLGNCTPAGKEGKVQLKKMYRNFNCKKHFVYKNYALLVCRPLNKLVCINSAGVTLWEKIVTNGLINTVIDDAVFIFSNDTILHLSAEAINLIDFHTGKIKRTIFFEETKECKTTNLYSTCKDCCYFAQANKFYIAKCTNGQIKLTAIELENEISLLKVSATKVLIICRKYLTKSKFFTTIFSYPLN